MNGNPRILITGGFGNLGSWLSEYFYKKGYDVTILANRVRELQSLKYSVIKADISDEDCLVTQLSGKKFDYCIHTASYNEHFHPGYAEKALLINSLGTRNLIQAIGNTGLKKFVYFSTVHVYGAQVGCVDEDTPPAPINDYATTHLFAELYLKQFYEANQFSSVTFRLTNSYGAPKSIESTKWYLVLNDLTKSAFEKKSIELVSNGQASRDFVWMGDVCRVTEKALFLDVGIETYNLSSRKNYKVIDLAYVVRDVYKSRYGKDVNIVINNADTSNYREITVENKKLLSSIDYIFKTKLHDEVNDIFELLEMRGE